MAQREYDNATDGELFTCWVESADEAALRAIVARHLPFLTRVAYQLKCPSHEVEDVCQTVVVKLIEKASTIRNRDSLVSWLYSVTQRTILESRRHKFQTVLPGDVEPMSNEKSIEDREQLCLLHEELGKLPDKYRDPIVLCDLQNRSRQFVAEALETTEAVIKARLERGRKLLKRRLLTRGVTLTSVVAMWHASSASAAEWISRPVVEELVRSGISTPHIAPMGDSSARIVFKKGSKLIANVMKKKMLSGVVIIFMTAGGVGTYLLSESSSPLGNRNDDGRDLKPLLQNDQDLASSGSEPASIEFAEISPDKIGKRSADFATGDQLTSSREETREGVEYAQDIFRQVFQSGPNISLDMPNTPPDVIEKIRQLDWEPDREQIMDPANWQVILFTSDRVNNHPDGIRLLIQIAAGNEVIEEFAGHKFVRNDRYISLLLAVKDNEWRVKDILFSNNYRESSQILREQIDEYPEE